MSKKTNQLRKRLEIEQRGRTKAEWLLADALRAVDNGNKELARAGRRIEALERQAERIGLIRTSDMEPMVRCQVDLSELEIERSTRETRQAMAELVAAKIIAQIEDWPRTRGRKAVHAGRYGHG